MKFKLPKIRGVKTHTPTFHVGDRKYKPGYWLQVKGVRRGRIGVSTRMGWREHDHSKSSNNRVDRRLSNLFSTGQNSAATFSGHNPLRSNYG